MRRWFLASIAAALAVVLAGCGSGKPGSGTAPAGDLGSASGSITAAAAVDEVAKLTDPNSALFDYTPFLPTQRVAPKAGARIAVVAAAMSSPVVKQYATAVIDAAEVAGFQAQTLDGKFQVDTQSSLIEQAVQHRYDGIVLVGVVPDTVVSALAQAKAAGIPVVSYDGYGDAGNGVTDIGIDPANAGVAVAKWIIADSGGKANVLAVTFPAGVSGGAKSIIQVGQEALIATLKKCAGCTVKTRDIAFTDVVAPGSPAYVNTLRQYPKGSIDYVASGCDTCMVVFSQINTQLGRTELKVTGGIAVGAEGLAEIASAQNKAMVAPVDPDQLIALLAVDTIVRRLGGQTVANMTKLPEPLVTTENAGKFPGSTFTPATDYVAKFRNLWKP